MFVVNFLNEMHINNQIKHSVGILYVNEIWNHAHNFFNPRINKIKPFVFLDKTNKTSYSGHKFFSFFNIALKIRYIRLQSCTFVVNTGSDYQSWFVESLLNPSGFQLILILYTITIEYLMHIHTHLRHMINKKQFSDFGYIFGYLWRCMFFVHINRHLRVFVDFLSSFE